MQRGVKASVLRDAAGERSAGAGRAGRLTQEERRDLSDARMFEAAMRLIGAHGANRTTLREICEQAGYSRGLANYRFGSKDGFLQELLKNFNRVWETHLQRYVGDKRGYAAIVAANHALESFLQERADDMRGGYIIWYESIGGDSAIRAKLRANHEIYRRDVARWVRQAKAAGEVSDVDAAQFASYYCSFVFGTIFQWLADPDGVQLGDLFGFFRRQMTLLLQPDRPA